MKKIWILLFGNRSSHGLIPGILLDIKDRLNKFFEDWDYYRNDDF